MRASRGGGGSHPGVGWRLMTTRRGACPSPATPRPLLPVARSRRTAGRVARPAVGRDLLSALCRRGGGGAGPGPPPNHEGAFGLGQVVEAGTGDVTGSHGRSRRQPGTASADQGTQPGIVRIPSMTRPLVLIAAGADWARCGRPVASGGCPGRSDHRSLLFSRGHPGSSMRQDGGGCRAGTWRLPACPSPAAPRPCCRSLLSPGACVRVPRCCVVALKLPASGELDVTRFCHACFG